ncbi:ABC transporter permease [Flavobacterium notoginsengisoli]|uniref:ABC transporter permease n=1 Tax=Flavobacterium notoginsengisoli TaxID=1478199 RepID=UPI00363E78B8
MKILQSEILIARHFKKSVFKNPAVYIITIFIGILLLYAAFTGWDNYKSQNETSEKYQHESREDWLKNPDKNPHRMAHYGNFAFRKSTPLSVFEFGMEPFFGNAIFLEAHKQNTANFSEAGFSNSMLRFGEISIAMVLQVLLPLLIFFLGFNAVAYERENGTLKILLTQGINWKQLLVGKTLGIASVIMLLFIPTIIVLVLVWLFLQNFSITADETIKMLLFILFHLAYLLFFCVIAVLISAISKTSKKALITLIGIWLLFTIILPRTTQAIGAYIYEAPSKIQFTSDIEKDILKQGDSHNPNDPHYKAIKDSLLTAYKVDSVQKLPFNYSGFIMTEGEKISSRIYNEHLAELLKIYKKQNSFSKTVSFLNPYIAIKNLSMGLSNTDYESYIDFQKQAEDYRYAMAQKMNALQIKYISNKKPGPNDKPLTIGKEHWADVEEFHYEPEKIGTVLKNEIVSIISILLWIAVLFILIRIASHQLKAI